jgi:diadenosine tetraphosphate (Ap4A) HIT family hydrolase
VFNKNYCSISKIIIIKGFNLSVIYKNDLIKIEIENSEIPWLKIFTIENIKEFSQCNNETKQEIFKYLDIIEKEMLDYFKPKKINIASFGNYVPHVHFHIMARFEEDSYFPEPMWGKKQRDANLNLPSFEEFYENLKKKF